MTETGFIFSTLVLLSTAEGTGNLKQRRSWLPVAPPMVESPKLGTGLATTKAEDIF